MYRPNDVLIEGHRLSNLFNSQDEEWHNQNIRPIRGLWSMTKVLEYEPLIDETINKFVVKLAQKFVDGKNAGTICPADEWIGYCKPFLSLSSRVFPNVQVSCLGCHCELQFWSPLWIHRPREGC